MDEDNKPAGSFVGYEYHTVTVDRKMESIYTDGYENFGWSREEAASSPATCGIVNLKFKRDRKIRNKAELTRLLPYFSYRSVLTKRGARRAPLIEKKHDEIYDICEKASHLLL